MAQPQSKAPRKPEPSPDDWVAISPTLVGPDGHRFAIGETVSEFAAWPERAQALLREHRHVARRRDIEPAPEHPIVQPGKVLIAKKSNKTPAQVAAQQERDIESMFTAFRHDMPDADGSDLVNVDPAPAVKLAEINYGDEVFLDDGTIFENKPPRKNLTPEEQMDLEEDQPTACTWCNQVFPGLASMKVHESRAHATQSMTLS